MGANHPLAELMKNLGLFLSSICPDRYELIRVELVPRSCQSSVFVTSETT